MFEVHRKEVMWGGRPLIMETGKIARQADGAVMITYGGTQVLCTAVAEKTPKPGLDFFPLTVNYQEKAFAAGVDDFMNKAHLRTQLLPRVVAADRITSRQNELMKSNKQLSRKVKELQTTDLVDPVTGLGNLKFTMERLDATLRESDTRGGAGHVAGGGGEAGP